MVDYNTRIIEGIKRTMKLSRTSMKSLSRNTGIPYRSIQNYLSGKTRMPADVYVQILDTLGVDNQYILHENFHPKYSPLWDSLWASLGDSLINTQYEPDTGFPDDIQFHNRKQAAGVSLIQRIVEHYDRYCLQYLQEGFAKGRSYPEMLKDDQKRHGGSQ